MKKGNRVKWIFGLIVILATLTIIVPIEINNYIKTEQESAHDKLVKIATSEKANKVYKQVLKNWDKEAFTSKGVIKSYRVDKNNVSHNPMGGYDVNLIINNDNKLILSTTIDSFNDGRTLEGEGSSCTNKLNDLLEKNNE